MFLHESVNMKLGGANFSEAIMLLEKQGGSSFLESEKDI